MLLPSSGPGQNEVEKLPGLTSAFKLPWSGPGSLSGQRPPASPPPRPGPGQQRCPPCPGGSRSAPSEEGRQTRPHGFLGGLLFPLLLRVAVVRQVAAAVGRAAGQLQLTVGRQRVVGRVLLVVLGRARLVGAGRRPRVVGGAARAELRAALGRGLQAPAAAGALGPRLPLPRAAQVRVVVLGRGARRAAHQPRQVRVLGRSAARGAEGPAAVGVGQGLAAAAALAVVFLQGVVLVEAAVRPRLRALKAAPAPRLVVVAVAPAGPLAIGVSEGRQLIHGDGRHPRGEVLPRQHLRLGARLAAGRGGWGQTARPSPKLEAGSSRLSSESTHSVLGPHSGTLAPATALLQAG
uniref:Uncharacterized protein n=1 Tax=Callithrix jacchus TaxID=9483 RepID=A0A5F4WH04_CALJA